MPPLKYFRRRSNPELFEKLAVDLNGAPQLYFPDLITDAAHGPFLAHLTYETLRGFQREASRLERESRLLELVGTVIEHCADVSLGERRMGQEHKAVASVKQALQADPALDTTLDDLAQLTQLNKHYLLKVFKRDVGISPHVFQTCLRIKEAKSLLRQGVPIVQVALDTGFVDQSHLHYTFKRYALVTPGQYQRDSLA